jgi:hypothetical protein
MALARKLRLADGNAHLRRIRPSNTLAKLANVRVCSKWFEGALYFKNLTTRT